MNEAWYRVCGMAFSAFSSFAAGLTVFLALRQNRWENRALKSARRDLPGMGDAYALAVVSAEGGRRVSAGERFPVPDEGTLGSARSCDVVIPYRGVRARTAFFWEEKDGLHMTPLSREGFFADGDRARPGDEAILREGAELRIGKLVLRLVSAEKGGRAAAPLRLRRGTKEPAAEKAGKEEKQLRGKKRAEQRGEKRADKGKAARAKADARRAPGGAARGKADGRKNPDEAPGAAPLFRVRSRDRAPDRRL